MNSKSCQSDNLLQKAHMKFTGPDLFESGHEKMYLMPYVNNKGVDQSAHSRSLISTFVVHCQDRMIPLVYMSEISRF